jgi:renierapurpurin 18,18'-hydroxylase
MDLFERRSNQPDLRTVGIHPDFWYPVARARELKKRATFAVQFAGEPIVLVRTDGGRVFALEDRCAHRQLPLHMGVVQGEQLKCCYHGWCYDGKGKLVRIPYLADGGTKLPPEARGVRAYPCREAYGLIFIFPGALELSECVPLPDVPEFSSPDYRTMHFSREVRCHYTFMHENLMDMNHQVLHRSLMGSIQPVLTDYRAGGDWVEAQYKFEGGKQHAGADLLVMGGKDEASAVQRDYELMTIRTDYPHQNLTVYRAHSEIPAIRLWASYVPLDAEQRRNRSFGLLMVRRPKIPGLLALAWPVIRYFAESVFAQDRRAVEQEQRAHDAQGGDWNREISPVLIELRRVLDANGVAPGSRARTSRPTEKLRAV